MTKQLINGVGSREVQDVDEIVPSWIQEDDVLSDVVMLTMEIKESIYGSHFEISPPECREPGLQLDRMFFRSKCLIANDRIKAEWPYGKDTGRFDLSRCW